MERRTRQETELAACLTGLAGYVEAMGLRSLRDLFGTLVKTGQQLTAVLFGELAAPFFQTLSLWLGLICGAVMANWIWMALGLNGIWIAAGAALLLSGVAARLASAKG